MIVNYIMQYLSDNNRTFDQVARSESIKYEVEKLAGWTFKRQFVLTDTATGPVIRLSSCGKCIRQQAYAYHGIEKAGKETDSRTKITFCMGDLTEIIVVAVAKLAGCTLLATGLNQIKVSVPVGNVLVDGHPDGLVLHDGSIHLLEVKSMSSFAFKRFERGDIDDVYIAQVQAYMGAMSLKKACIVALNKDAGVLSERIIEFDEQAYAALRNNLDVVVKSTPVELPAPRYQAEKGQYPWQCLYCAWWKICKPNAELVLKGNKNVLRERGKS